MNQEQMSLIADTPIARRTDPDTSKLAAAVVTENGTRADQQKYVLAMVESNPGLTSAELAHRFHVDRYMPARRLPELRSQLLVCNGEKRTCKQTNCIALTWYPVASPERTAA